MSVQLCINGSNEHAFDKVVCQKHNVFPKEQFGFVPGGSCQQALFVLRHLAQNQCQQCWRGSNKRLWIAFIDLQAAYDHVNREALWHHRQHATGGPSQLLIVIQNMYSGDVYRLVDGLTSTAILCLSMGVKQVAHFDQSLFLSQLGADFGVRH
jgi:hypothetical protein